MGVLTYTFPTSTFNFVTFTAKRWGYFPTVTYVAGGTAGQEVVSTDGSHNIFVQIQSGVSTNAQIKSAIDATVPSPAGMSAGDYVDVMIAAGHSTDTNVPGTSPAMSGAVAPDALGFYADENVKPLTPSFQLYKFPLNARVVLLVNRTREGNASIVYSWDGINNHGIIEVGQSHTLDKNNACAIFLKYINSAPSYKLMVRTNV